MSRKLQHIASSYDIDDAIHKGKKVTALCGAKKYPLRGMGEEIPTCTPCSRAAMRLIAGGAYGWGGN